jgi:TRAP-type C4-dicarboxylate transport system substrate-binding protein
VIFHGFKYYDVAKYQIVLPKSYLMACGVANKAFLNSLGPELGGIVREEAAKAQSVFLTASPAEFESGRKAWEQNGGQVLEFPSADAKRYLDTATSSIASIINAPALKPEVDALSAAALRAKSQ